MENVDELLEQYRNEAAQFTLTPRPAVWEHIDAEINPPRRKRRFLFIWWLLGCLAAYGFYAAGTRYIAHSTVAHIHSKPQLTAHHTPPHIIAIAPIQTNETNKTHKKQKIAKRHTATISTATTSKLATPPAQTFVLRKQAMQPTIASGLKAMATNSPTLPAAAPVALPKVWPHPIHRLVVLQPVVPVPVIIPHRPQVVTVPAINAVPLSSLVTHAVKAMPARPTQWSLPVRSTLPEISYPATATLSPAPVQPLPYATRMTLPGTATLPLLAAPKQTLRAMAVLHTPKLLPISYHQLGTAFMVANIPNPYTYTSFTVLPAHAKLMVAHPQTVQTLPLAGVGKIMGTPVHSLAATAPARLPTPTTYWASAPVLPPAIVYGNTTAASMAPAPHIPLPIAHSGHQNVVANQHHCILQAATPSVSPAFGPTVYPTFETYNEEPDENMLAKFEYVRAAQQSAGNLASLQESSLLLLAATPHAHLPGMRKMPATAQTSTDTPSGKPTTRRWAAEFTGGPSFNKHTITEPGQYQFIRSYRDSTDTRIRTAQWAVGLRYALNSRVSLLLNGSLVQTGEEIRSRQRVYSADTVLINISSVGPTFGSQTVMIVGKNYDINGDSTGRLRNTVTYASVGVGMRYHLFSAGKLSMGMQPSVSLAWRAAGRMYTYDSTVHEWRAATKNEMAPHNTTASFGLYAEYRLSPSVSVSVMPHYTRYMGPAIRQSPVAIQYNQTSLLGTLTWWFR